MFTEDMFHLSLCNSHNTIRDWAKDIKNILKKDIKSKDFSHIEEEVIPIINSIIAEARVAKRKGQRMENRLKAYHDSIVALGFKREGR